MEFIGRGLRGTRAAASLIRSSFLLGWYRALYPGLTVGRRVTLGNGVHISVVRGARMSIGDEVSIGSNSQLIAEGILSIGPNGFIGHGSTIVAAERICIGRDALIAEHVTIRDQDHRTDRLDLPYNKQGLATAPVSIGDNVWIGAKATILRGVTIGADAVVAAHSLVNQPVETGTIVAGVPARRIKTKGQRLEP